MAQDDKARRLADQLQKVLEGAEAADRSNPVVNEKLSPQELKVMRTVGCSGECPIMSKIAGAIRLSLSSVTGLIDRLTEKKLVRRDRSTEDRRIVQVELTQEGKELHAAVEKGRVEFARELLKKLDAKEQETLLNLLGRVVA
jgi:DNA-binding MarR family transcriptional regulator